MGCSTGSSRSASSCSRCAGCRRPTAPTSRTSVAVAGVLAGAGKLSRVASVRMREYGVRATDLDAQRAALIEFAAEMYRPLVRCDQRAKGEQYVRGLLLEGRRKSIQPMAARLADGDEEGLQHFITDSPWDDEPVRRRLARRMTAEIEPDGWIVDDAGLPQDGRFSPGVAPQYWGVLGKRANCQVGVSVNAATDRAACPLGWLLF